MTHADTDHRPTLEGTLTDFPIAELLGLLGATHQTGTLQVSVRPAALITIVDGRVAFASTDPAFTVRDLLVGGGVVDADTWQQTVSSGVEVRGLGAALVRAGTDEDAMQRAIQEQVVAVCETLVDYPVARFRFVRQSRSSMGEAFACPVSLLRERLTERADEWARLRTVVTSGTAAVEVRHDLAAGWDQIVVDRVDWPVFIALRDAATPTALAGATGLGIFDTTRSIVRLWEAGAIVVDGVGAPVPGTGDTPAGGPVGAPATTVADDDPFSPADAHAADTGDDATSTYGTAEATEGQTTAEHGESVQEDLDAPAVGAAW